MQVQVQSQTSAIPPFSYFVDVDIVERDSSSSSSSPGRLVAARPAEVRLKRTERRELVPVCITFLGGLSMLTASQPVGPVSQSASAARSTLELGTSKARGIIAAGSVRPLLQD